jgi:hypothetical protein
MARPPNKKYCSWNYSGIHTSSQKKTLLQNAKSIQMKCAQGPVKYQSHSRAPHSQPKHLVQFPTAGASQPYCLAGYLHESQNQLACQIATKQSSLHFESKAEEMAQADSWNTTSLTPDKKPTQPRRNPLRRRCAWKAIIHGFSNI